MFRTTCFNSISLAAVLIGSLCAAQETQYLLHYDQSTTVLGSSEFPRPVWMAVVSEGEGGQFIVGLDEPVFRLGQAHPVAIVRGIDPEVLTVNLPDARRTVQIRRGQGIPGATEFVFREAVRVTAIEYRRRMILPAEMKRRDGELYLVAVRGSRVIVQRDVDPSASPAAIQEQRLADIPLVRTAPNTWEVSAKDVRVAIESGEAIAARSLRDSRVDLSLDRGISVEVKSPLADVRVDQQGFLINDPKLAKRAGLLVGDRILDVNGTPIDGIGALMREYLRVKSDKALKSVSVTVERNRQPVTLTYRIR